MKAVWIGCTALCLCGLFFSGALFFMGASLLSSTRTSETEADAYALAAVRAVCRHWDADELARHLDSSAPPGLAKRLTAAGGRLGALRSAEPFAATAVDASTTEGVKTMRATVRDVATYERGRARLTLLVVSSGEGWRIRDFQVAPINGNGP